MTEHIKNWKLVRPENIFLFEWRMILYRLSLILMALNLGFYKILLTIKVGVFILKSVFSVGAFLWEFLFTIRMRTESIQDTAKWPALIRHNGRSGRRYLTKNLPVWTDKFHNFV
jgi:hypothetical protein